MDFVNLNQIEKNEGEIRITVLTNIVKMLSERMIIDKSKIETMINKLVNDKRVDESTYILDTDTKTKIAIKIFPIKITAVNKTFGVIEFLNQYKDTHKILVIKEINKKAQQYILNNFNNIEIFLEEELMINLIDHILVPKHEVLGSQEAETFYETYNCKKKNMPRMLITDPVARYYNMKVGDICRITRPSETAGYTYTYRLVK